MVTREMDVTGFTTLDIGGNFSIIYRQGPEASLTVVMQENLFEYLNTTVRGGSLQISTRRNFDTTNANRPRLYVYAPYLTAVDLSGAINASGWDVIQGQSFTIDTSGAASIDIALEVTSLNVDASGAVSLNLDMTVENLDMDVSGAADVRLSGVANTINIEGSGALSIRAGNLEIESGRVRLSGAANVYLSSLENVTVNTSGLARVREAS